MKDNKSAHPLKTYLEERSIPMKQAARDMNVDYSTVRNICTGRYNPNNVTCLKIEDYTRGELKALDLIKKEDHFTICPCCNRYTLQVKKIKTEE